MATKNQTRKKHVPQRTCVICKKTHPKRALTRIVRTPDNGVQIDTTGKLSGRGAYLCPNPECWQRAAQSKALDKALRVTLSEEERHAITVYMVRTETD